MYVEIGINTETLKLTLSLVLADISADYASSAFPSVEVTSVDPAAPYVSNAISPNFRPRPGVAQKRIGGNSVWQT